MNDDIASWPDTGASQAARQRFTAGLGQGAGSDWIDAFASVPRHVFVPRFHAPTPDGTWTSLSWGDSGYLEGVYSDDALVTQLDDHGIPTSSSSRPATMLTMLDALGAQSGDHVFELGLGTGYNAALLAHRLGDSAVTSVDIDPQLVSDAAGRLARAGYRPYVTTGDGAAGFPQRAPYQRIIATAALSCLPPALLDQAAPRAVLVAPLGMGIVRAEITGPGRAEGSFLPGETRFMRRRVPDAGPDFAALAHAEPTTAAVDPGTVLARLAWPLSIALPGHTVSTSLDDTGTVTSVALWTPDGSTAAAAMSGAVRQTGPRRLWNTVEDLAKVFDTAPAREDFHLIADHGHQSVHYRDPSGPSWELPTAGP